MILYNCYYLYELTGNFFKKLFIFLLEDEDVGNVIISESKYLTH